MVSNISLGSGGTIGNISLTQDNPIVGSGYPYNPRLSIPITVTLQPKPDEETLIVTEVVCSLWAGNEQVGLPVVNNLLEGMYCRSYPGRSNSHAFSFHFPLSGSHIQLLEKQRHQHPNHDFVGTLRFQATVARRIQTVSTEFGNYYILAPYQYVKVDDVSIRVPSSDWVEYVLANVGLAHFRFVEIELPRKESDFSREVISHLDSARQSFDVGDYHKCIGDCRYIRDEVNKYFGASDKQGSRLADKVAQKLGLPDDSLQKTFLDQTWKGFTDLTNAEHHIADRARLLPADAHTCLLLIVVLLEYLSLAR